MKSISIPERLPYPNYLSLRWHVKNLPINYGSIAPRIKPRYIMPEFFCMRGVIKAIFQNKQLTEKEEDHIIKAIGAAKKGFAYIFNQFLVERYGGSNMTLPSGQALYKVEIDPDAGDVASLKESALRIAGSICILLFFREV